MTDIYQTTNSQKQTTNINVQTTDELEETTEKTEYLTVKEVEKRLGIKYDTLYQRMKYLEMKAHKFEGRALLDPEQVTILEQLHEHIKQTGKMGGFPKSKSMVAKEEKKVAAVSVFFEDHQQIQQETKQSVVAQEQSQALVVAEEYTKLDLENQQQLQAQPVTTTDNKAYIEEIKKEAADLSFSKQMAVLNVARAYTENPQFLPEDIKQQLEEAKMAAIKAQPLHQKAFYDPKELTQLVMETL